MTGKVRNIPGQANSANIPQFNWPQLAAFILLPVAWWFILLYGIAPLLRPAFSTPKGELNAFAVLSITTLGYLFEFFLALNIFRKEAMPCACTPSRSASIGAGHAAGRGG